MLLAENIGRNILNAIIVLQEKSQWAKIGSYTKLRNQPRSYDCWILRKRSELQWLGSIVQQSFHHHQNLQLYFSTVKNPDAKQSVRITERCPSLSGSCALLVR